MPLIISRPPMAPLKIANRSKAFNETVRALASWIALVRNEGNRSVEEIMKALNAHGVPAPNGKAFTYGTTHRVLKRLKELGLGDGPRSVSKANSQRGYTPRGIPASASITKLAQAQPELFRGTN